MRVFKKVVHIGVLLAVLRNRLPFRIHVGLHIYIRVSEGPNMWIGLQYTIGTIHRLNFTPPTKDDNNYIGLPRDSRVLNSQTRTVVQMLTPYL